MKKRNFIDNGQEFDDNDGVEIFVMMLIVFGLGIAFMVLSGPPA